MLNIALVFKTCQHAINCYKETIVSSLMTKYCNWNISGTKKTKYVGVFMLTTSMVLVRCGDNFDVPIALYVYTSMLLFLLLSDNVVGNFYYHHIAKPQSLFLHPLSQISQS